MKYVENFEEKLDKFAEVIIKIGANVQKGQKVWINCTTDSLPLVYKVTEKAYKAGASNVNVKLADDKLRRMHAEYQSTEEYSTIPKWTVDEMNDYLDNNVVFIHILSSSPELFSGIDAEKLGAYAKNRGEALKYYRSRVMNDINSWTIVSYPSPEWAKLVFPEESDVEKAQAKLLDAILETIRVNEKDPVEAWKEHSRRLTEKADYLNKKAYKALHYKAEGTDLVVGLPENHVWIAAGSKNEKGADFMPNMPTEEIFTAGDKYRVDGYVSNKKPLSYQGNIIDGFKLTFKDGKVVDFEAEKGYDILKQLIETDEGSGRIGEVALVPNDSPISNSGLLYYETLFDENAANSEEFKGLSQEECDNVFLDYFLVMKAKKELIAKNVKEVSESEARIMDFNVIEVSDYNLATDLLNRLNNGENCVKLATQFSENSDISRSVELNNEPEDIKSALGVLEDGGVSPILTNKGKYILYKCVKSNDEEATKKNKEKIKNERESAYLLNMYNDFVKSNPIDINDSEFDKVCKNAFFTISGKDFFTLWAEDNNGGL